MKSSKHLTLKLKAETFEVLDALAKTGDGRAKGYGEVIDEICHHLRQIRWDRPEYS